MKQLEQLMFSVSLLDSVSAPVRQIQQTIGALKTDAIKSFQQIGVGAAGMFASAYALNKAIQPAREVKKVLGELASLDVSNNSLDKMLDKSLEYSIQFGGNAKDFIGSAYDIQSSIENINGTQLANLTATSNTLALATKSDASTITDYMGTMYGIFKDSANKAGVDVWANNLAGMTATSVKMFKTEGTKVSAFFTSIGADATKMGMTLKEQLAVGGMLGATLSGSEAGTKLKSFLSGVGKAQKELNLDFTDDGGRMLPIVEILEKIKGKYGDLSKVADSDLIKKAFGTKEAASFIKLIGQDTDTLTNSIEQIGRTDGLKKVINMATKIVDPVDRVTSGVNALRIAFGKPLSDWMDPYFNKLADGMAQVLKWTNDYPHLTKAISLTGGALIALVGITGALFLVTGLAKLAFVGLRAVMLIFLPMVWATNIAMATLRGLFFAGMFLKSVLGVLRLTKVMGGLRAVVLAVNMAMITNPAGILSKSMGFLKSSIVYVNTALKITKGLMIAGYLKGVATAGAVLTKTLTFLRGIMLAVNAAILANPIVAIIVAIAGLTAGVIGLIFYWDDLRANFSDNAFIMGLMDIIEMSLNPFKAFSEAIQWIIELWDGAKANLGDSIWSQLLIAAVELALLPLRGMLLVFDNVQKAWISVTDYFSSTVWASKLKETINSVKGIIDGLMKKWTSFMASFDKVKSKISGGISSVKETLGLKKKPLPLVSAEQGINLGNSVSIDQMIKSSKTPVPSNDVKVNNTVAAPIVNIQNTAPKIDVPQASLPNNVTQLNNKIEAPVVRIDVPKAPMPDNVTQLNNKIEAPIVRVDVPKAPIPNNVTEISQQTAIPKVSVNMPENPMPDNIIQMSKETDSPKKVEISSLKESSTYTPSANGAKSVINNQTKTTNNNSRSGMQIGSVQIYPQDGFDAQRFEQELEMAIPA